MITQKDYCEAQLLAAKMIRNAGIHITDKEVNAIEIVDFGLSHLAVEGVQVFTMVNTERISAKVLVLFPNQTEPEHWHPPVENNPGKEETIRAIWGTVRFYIPGENTLKEGFILEGKEHCYTMRHEIDLKPGDLLTLEPGTKHWFQAGEEGAVMYSFSTCVRDVLDQFSDSEIDRITKIVD